jgi:hypothetical protein
MWNVIFVAKEQLQRVLTWSEGHFRFGLPGTEMQMVEVVWDRVVQGRQWRVYQQMMVPGVWPVRSRRRYAHISKSKANHTPRGNGSAVLWVHEVNSSARR